MIISIQHLPVKCDHTFVNLEVTSEQRDTLSHSPFSAIPRFGLINGCAFHQEGQEIYQDYLSGFFENNMTLQAAGIAVNNLEPS